MAVKPGFEKRCNSKGLRGFEGDGAIRVSGNGHRAPQHTLRQAAVGMEPDSESGLGESVGGFAARTRSNSKILEHDSAVR